MKMVTNRRLAKHCVLCKVARRFPTFFASTQPFGTPFGPIALKYILTILVICVLPVHDAFNSLLDLVSYLHLVHIFFSNITG
jgi:hypothetical protein